MATQQQSRPWARIATMVRPPPPPAAQPPPRPPPPPLVIRRQPSPVVPVAPRPVASPTITTTPRVTTPKSPPHPTSPLRLSSPQHQLPNPTEEIYQRQKYAPETKEKPDPKSLDNRTSSKNTSLSSLSSSDEQMKMRRIVTIAGENKGAIMDMMTPFNKTTHGHMIHPSSSTTNGENNSSFGEGKSIAKSPPMMSALMNSNVQGVNNSILYNSSTTHHDPGVHFTLTRKPDV